ncbi:PhzF family phenazine biosynthesis protein [Arthrobacter halodurans]|uniref:PhzF family phenazine biosynthesis protein n=1 Tax=Arthrobacter halodurans TaxID=516699 RepID=A0ABV4UQ52_9MICC
MHRPYKQVDVFTSVPYLGNALAVVLDGEGLSDAEMLRFANWTNLAETTFVLPPTRPGADYRVRIFTTTTELPFAGHPTLGTAHAWLEAGGRPASPGMLIQECGAGLIEVRTDAAGGDDGGRRLALKAPPLVRTGPLEDDVLEWALAGLGLRRGDVLDHQWVANGPQWAGLLLRDADAVLALEPDFVALEGLEVGVIGAHTAPGTEAARYDSGARVPRPKGARAELEPLPGRTADDAGAAFQSAVAGAPADFEVRAFCPGEGLPEDPVTGSLNAGLAQWLVPAGLAPEQYTVRQGTRLGRAGYVDISTDTGGIWIAGQAVTCIDGTVRTR